MRATPSTSEAPKSSPVADAGELVAVAAQHWIGQEWNYRMRVGSEYRAFPGPPRGPVASLQRLAYYQRKDHVARARIEVYAEPLEREVAAGDWLLLSPLLHGKDVLQTEQDALGASRARVEALWTVRGKPRRGRIHCMKSGARMFVLVCSAPERSWDVVRPQLDAAVDSFEPVVAPAHRYVEPLQHHHADEPVAWDVALPASWVLLPGTSGPEGASFQAENKRHAPDERPELIGKLAFAVLARSAADTPRDVAEVYLGALIERGLDVGSEVVALVAPRRPFSQAWTLHAPVWREKLPGEVLVRVLCHRTVWILAGVVTLRRDDDASAWMQNKRALDLVITSLKLASD